MSLFDWVKSSYPLPNEFMGICQSKTLDDAGGSMSHYWIAPDGYLWCGDYQGCHTLEFYEEGDPEYDPKFVWRNMEYVPTGKHGKWRVHPVTLYATIYPAEWSGSWETWPLLRVHFRSGRLQDFEEVTGR